MMELHFLGTGSCYPSPKRGASCIALRHENAGVWLFDCGEGTQIQLQKSEVKPGRINKIFITHLHGDHLFGLPGLMCTIGQNNLPEEKRIDIYGPRGLGTFLRTSLSVSASQLGYSYCVHEIVESDSPSCEISLDSDAKLHPNEIQPPRVIKMSKPNKWQICESAGLKVDAYFLEHAIFCVGYVITEDSLPGKLDPTLLRSMGIPPGPLYGKLKRGETVLLEDGRVIEPSSIVGPPRKGRVLVILGDTSNSETMLSAVKDVDVIIHETTVENELETLAVERGHSTPGMAGKFASMINAKMLIINHFSQRYKALDSELKEGDISVTKLLEQAKECFTGEVVAADDFKVVSIKIPQ